MDRCLWQYMVDHGETATSWKQIADHVSRELSVMVSAQQALNRHHKMITAAHLSGDPYVSSIPTRPGRSIRGPKGRSASLWTLVDECIEASKVANATVNYDELLALLNVDGQKHYTYNQAASLRSYELRKEHGKVKGKAWATEETQRFKRALTAATKPGRRRDWSDIVGRIKEACEQRNIAYGNLLDGTVVTHKTKTGTKQHKEYKKLRDFVRDEPSHAKNTTKNNTQKWTSVQDSLIREASKRRHPNWREMIGNDAFRDRVGLTAAALGNRARYLEQQDAISAHEIEKTLGTTMTVSTRAARVGRAKVPAASRRRMTTTPALLRSNEQIDAVPGVASFDTSGVDDIILTDEERVELQRKIDEHKNMDTTGIDALPPTVRKWIKRSVNQHLTAGSFSESGCLTRLARIVPLLEDRRLLHNLATTTETKLLKLCAGTSADVVFAGTPVGQRPVGNHFFDINPASNGPHLKPVTWWSTDFKPASCSIEQVLQGSWVEQRFVGGLRSRPDGRTFFLRYLDIVTNPDCGNFAISTGGNPNRGTMTKKHREHVDAVLFAGATIDAAIVGVAGRTEDV